MFFTMLKDRFMPLFEEAGDLGGGAETNPAPGADPAEDGVAKPQAIETIKLDFLGEEKEVSLEEAKTLAQKGMNYDPIKEKWEASKSTISAFEEIARKAGFVDANGHGDINAYREAANEQIKASEIESLTRGLELPKELAEELYLSRKEREERKAEKERLEVEQRKQSQYAELFDFYKEVNGKDFDPATTTLPKEVWAEVEKGVSPKHAYAEHLARQLLKDQAINQANLENGQASPGSVAGKGAGAEKEFFTSEELDKLTAKDLDNPTIYEKAMRSLSKIGS